MLSRRGDGVDWVSTCWHGMLPWHDLDIIEDSSSTFIPFLGICLMVLNFESHMSTMDSTDSQRGFTGLKPISGVSQREAASLARRC